MVAQQAPLIADKFTKVLIYKCFGHFCHLLAPFAMKACRTLSCTRTERPMRTASSSLEAMRRRTVQRLTCKVTAISEVVIKVLAEVGRGLGALMRLRHHGLQQAHPNGEKVRVQGCDVYTFRSGRVVRKDSYRKIVE